MNVLVPNLGSTSLKYQILEMPGARVIARGRLERVTDYRQAIGAIDPPAGGVDVVAFKAVHGGPRYRGTFVIDDGVLAALEEFLSAAPVHNAIYLAGIRAFRERMPEATLVAAFETEFHATMPEHAQRYGVPAEWRESYGVRRYGFHGASHQYVAERAPEILGRETPRLVSCHLGGSSSMCAIERGRSIDTTMGFSPQSGLENAQRHGDLDAFAVLYMMQRHGWSVAETTAELTRGGLEGLSGIAGEQGLEFRVSGPEKWGVSSLFPNPMELVQYQSEYERYLIDSGFTVSMVNERRRSGDRRKTARPSPERRR
ncbi:MAG: hypothetical protein ACRD44_07950 [Bryobacteraceae bacterium]